jgi:hypothetical protein
MRRLVSIPCQVVRERDFRLLAERTLDVSPYGLLVPTEEDVLTGEEVLVSFLVPRTSFWVDASGTIARVVHGRRPQDPGRALGVVLRGLADDVQALLTARLRGLPPPLPARPSRPRPPRPDRFRRPTAPPLPATFQRSALVARLPSAP